MRGRRVRLLTVAGAGATADVVVAADVPVGQLWPALAKLVGGWELPPDDPRWVLLTAGGTDPSASTPAPVDRRFGAASLGHPDRRPSRQPAWRRQVGAPASPA